MHCEISDLFQFSQRTLHKTTIGWSCYVDIQAKTHWFQTKDTRIWQFFLPTSKKLKKCSQLRHQSSVWDVPCQKMYQSRHRIRVEKKISLFLVGRVGGMVCWGDVSTETMILFATTVKRFLHTTWYKYHKIRTNRQLLNEVAWTALNHSSGSFISLQHHHSELYHLGHIGSFRSLGLLYSDQLDHIWLHKVASDYLDHIGPLGSIIHSISTDACINVEKYLERAVQEQKYL